MIATAKERQPTAPAGTVAADGSTALIRSVVSGVRRSRGGKPASWPTGPEVSALLDERTVHELVQTGVIPASDVRMARDGAMLRRDRYARHSDPGAPAPDVVRPDDVTRELTAGATLILRHLERVHEPLRDFCARLSAELDVPIDAGCYLTPALSTGFSWHADPQETVILQIEGTKHWQVCDGAFDLTDQGVTLGERPDAPLLVDSVLQPGDMLYMPIGYPHAAAARARSLHVTVALWPR